MTATSRAPQMRFGDEFPALRNKALGDTLSERPHPKWGVAGAGAFGGFLVWFLFHILAGMA